MNIKNITLIPVQTIGVGLDKMDDMLLRMIEELTLYVIEQNKTINQQQQIIDALIERIENLENKE